ncbi:MAG: DUF1127 domain-containing protein [Hyphomicrobiales bacterium]
MLSLIESRAESLGELPEQWNLGRIVRHWQARRAVRAMLAWEDHLLRDIGVERAEVEWAAHLPLTRNATLALEERALVRQRRAGKAA